MQRLQETYAFNPDAQKRVLQEQQATYAADDALRSNWVAGAKQAARIRRICNRCIHFGATGGAGGIQRPC